MIKKTDSQSIGKSNSLGGFIGYLLLHSLACIPFALIFGFIDMAYYISSKGAGYAGEFVGLIVVTDVIVITPISCLIAGFFHTFIYLNVKSDTKHRYSIVTTLLVCVGVGLIARSFLTK
jgi:hypothetical protein